MLVMNVLVLALAPYVEYRSVTNRLSPRSCVRLMSNPKMTPQMIKEATERVAQGLDVLKYRAETGGLTAEEQTELTRLLDRLSQLDDVMTEAEIELQQKKIQLDAGVVFPTKRPDALRSPPDRGATSDAGLVFPVPLVGIPMSMEAPAAATSASSTAAAKEPGPHISMPAVSAPSELPPQVTIRRPPAASVPSEMPPRITIRRPAPEAPSGVSSQHANAPATVLDTWGLRTADETPFVADSDAPTAPSLGSGMGRFASPAEKRDASTIFFEGLGNLAKEPLGWLDGAKPSPLTSSLPVDVTTAKPSPLRSSLSVDGATSEARKPVSVGDRVLTELGDEGYVRFIGETSFNPGVWVGVALLEPKGKHDGTVEGVRYFECPPNHGLFARAQKLTPIETVGESPSLAALAVAQKLKQVPQKVQALAQNPWVMHQDAKSLSKQEKMLASFVAAGVLATFGVSSSFLRLPLPMPLTQLASSLAETRDLGLSDLEAAKEKLRSSVEALKPAPETAPCDAVGCFQEDLEEEETAAERRARIAAWNAQLEAEAKVVQGLPAKIAPEVDATGQSLKTEDAPAVIALEEGAAVTESDALSGAAGGPMADAEQLAEREPSLAGWTRQRPAWRAPSTVHAPGAGSEWCRPRRAGRSSRAAGSWRAWQGARWRQRAKPSRQRSAVRPERGLPNSPKCSGRVPPVWKGGS